MKRILTAAALLLAVALQMMGQAGQKSMTKGGAPAEAVAPPDAMCTGPDGKACTAAHVKQLNDVMLSVRKAGGAPLKAVTLASADGTLKCDGKACTADQVEALSKAAAQFKCAINYNSSKSNTVNRSNIKNN
jgi:hypothetical protein